MRSKSASSQPDQLRSRANDAFSRGALLAQSPQDLETIPELTEEDREWIRLEKTREYL